MADVGIIELLIRTAVSLGAVLLVIAVAYVIAKRRNGGGSGRQPRLGRLGQRSAGRKPPATLETIARVGLSRGSSAVVVRFGDQIVLLGVTESGPINVLQGMPAQQWDELAAAEDVVATPVPIGVSGDLPTGVDRPGFVEALRQATARRA